ncbi:trimeric intracellular cation channel family protein [Oleiharenicola lentus]|uniref:trimeric intracellular cation channel family protein n=1 Tax=Oleiharenicola lentus TaxID=2508720 RepID=UPI003F672466
MIHGSFDLPVAFDLGATFAFALSGALAAIKRNYDIVGVIALALVSGIGGGLIRDGLFLSQGPTPLLTNPNYIFVILGAVVAGVLFGLRIHHFARLIAVIDALGLGAYAAFGVQKSLLVGLTPPAAVLVGVVNAVGGGILRDLLCREEPLVFKPGQFYLLVALGGAVTFVFCSATLELSANNSAAIAITVTFVFRILTILLNWRTASVSSGSIFENDDTPPPPPTKNP